MRSFQENQSEAMGRHPDLIFFLWGYTRTKSAVRRLTAYTRYRKELTKQSNL